MDKNNIVTMLLGIVILVVLISFFMILKDEDLKNNDVAQTNSVKVNQNNNEIEKENMKQTDFSIAFLKLENNSKNVVYSPLSIKYALHMLLEGAEGNTKAEIEKVLNDLELTKYQDIDKVLSLANALYIRDNYTDNVKETYIEDLKENYDAEVKFDSFSNAKNVNNWIENKTFGKIKNMLKDEVVSRKDNKMILINALAIDMEWKENFQRRDTYGRTFYKLDSEKIEATTMSQKFTTNSASYYKDSSVTALTMDLKKYDDLEFEFVAIMPEKDLPKYVENFDIKKLNEIDSKLTLASKTKNQKGIEVSIPKFKFDYSLSLMDDLKTLGIKDAFSISDADFSNMVENAQQFYVGDALHKADIEFSEEGIKAAAATVIFMVDGAMFEEEKPINITINKPFLYLIREKNSKDIWFVGTVYEPNLWEKDKEEYTVDY